MTGVVAEGQWYVVVEGEDGQGLDSVAVTQQCLTNVMQWAQQCGACRGIVR